MLTSLVEDWDKLSAMQLKAFLVLNLEYLQMEL